mmetsp:Transcript_31117/g.99523  ORF Transcript_31117/g.99523 Transcript_31117/m.99523 type:complete len:221 (+) Transcript_31117:627-1289(+)
MSLTRKRRSGSSSCRPTRPASASSPAARRPAGRRCSCLPSGTQAVPSAPPAQSMLSIRLPISRCGCCRSCRRSGRTTPSASQSREGRGARRCSRSQTCATTPRSASLPPSTASTDEHSSRRSGSTPSARTISSLSGRAAGGCSPSQTRATEPPATPPWMCTRTRPAGGSCFSPSRPAVACTSTPSATVGGASSSARRWSESAPSPRKLTRTAQTHSCLSG